MLGQIPGKEFSLSNSFVEQKLILNDGKGLRFSIRSNMMNNRLQVRKSEYDLLRIIAIFAVIIIHVIGSTFFGMGEIGSAWWNKLNLLDSGLRWCVPALVMLSGALFLNPEKDISIKSIYQKHIFRIVTAFIFWSILYTIVNYCKYPRELDVLHCIADFTISVILKPNYHLWYIYLIVGLYMITPILRQVICTCTDKLLHYWLGLMFLFGIVIPALRDVGLIESYIGDVLGYMHIEFLAGYVFYYVAGYYISSKQIRHKKVIYVAGVIGYIATVLGTIYLSNRAGYTASVYDYLYPNTSAIAVAIFVFFTKEGVKWRFSAKAGRVLEDLASSMFGVYLMHDLLLQLFDYWNITIGVFQSIAIAILIASVVFISCSVITLLLRKIPFARRHLL